MYQQKLISTLLFTMTFSLSHGQLKTFDFGAFEITGPETWEVVDVQGIDSYVKMLTTESGDTLHFDYGYYSNSLTEHYPMVQSRKYIDWFIENDIDTSGFYFIDSDTVKQEDYAKFLKQQTVYELIDGFEAKIITPKTIGVGITGVYFDSLGTGGIGNIRLNFLGQDLKRREHVQLLKALKTIKFK